MNIAHALSKETLQSIQLILMETGQAELFPDGQKAAVLHGGSFFAKRTDRV